jgi:phospholipid-binding lipoprotein MlaA
MTPRRLAAALVLAALPPSGCVPYPPGWDAARQGRDPYEGANRAVFGFNEGVDRYVMGPLATGWTWITFEAMRESVDRFFGNLRFPVRFVSSLGQGKLGGAGRELGRFATNTTIGVVGLFDPASRFGLRPSNEDFGQMFGAWGVPAGPYWVVPILGPSGPRDFAGGLCDMVFDLGIGFSVAGIPGVGLLNIVNARALADDRIRETRASALDLYVSVRDAYTRNREDLVEDRTPGGAIEGEAPPPDDSLYELGPGSGGGER